MTLNMPLNVRGARGPSAHCDIFYDPGISALSTLGIEAQALCDAKARLMSDSDSQARGSDARPHLERQRCGLWQLPALLQRARPNLKVDNFT